MDFAQQAHLPVKHGVASNTKEAKIGHFSDLHFYFFETTKFCILFPLLLKREKRICECEWFTV